MNVIASLGAWSWFIFGVALMIAEVLAPGAFMLWLGLSAFLVGLISFAVDWNWQAQCVAFAVFAVASIPIWRKLGKRLHVDGGGSFLNRRTEALIGRVLTLETPIVDGVGTVRIDDTVWRVNGPDCSDGSKVKIVKADGASLTVAPE